jgi:cytochrome c
MIVKKILVAFLAVIVAVSAIAATRGTPAEAKALLAKAIDHYKKVGRKQALADFNQAKPPWKDRDLYVWCASSDSIILANGGFPSLVGSSTNNWKDVDGKPVGKATWEVASKKGSGSLEYRWFNPVTGKMEPKVTFFQKVADDLVCGTGAYNPPHQ